MHTFPMCTNSSNYYITFLVKWEYQFKYTWVPLKIIKLLMFKTKQTTPYIKSGNTNNGYL